MLSLNLISSSQNPVFCNILTPEGNQSSHTLKSLGGLGYILAYFEKLFFTATNPNTLGLEGLADNREGKEEGREICLPKQSHVWAPRNKQPSKTILPAEGRETRVGSCKAGGCDHTFPSRTVIREIQTGQIS